MSVVHRVIVLNKPFKIQGYTIMQWIFLAGSFALAILAATKIPGDWKIGNLPVGLFVFIGIVSIGIVYVMALQMKPITWWKNKIVYGLRLAPTVYLPKREPGQIYPDPTIKEVVKREDQAYVIDR